MAPPFAASYQADESLCKPPSVSVAQIIRQVGPSAFARVVFPSPGRSSKSRWPRASRHASTCSMTAGLPRKAWFSALRRRARGAADACARDGSRVLELSAIGSNSGPGAVDLPPAGQGPLFHDLATDLVDIGLAPRRVRMGGIRCPGRHLGPLLERGVVAYAPKREQP